MNKLPPGRAEEGQDESEKRGSGEKKKKEVVKGAECENNKL